MRRPMDKTNWVTGVQLLWQAKGVVRALACGHHVPSHTVLTGARPTSLPHHLGNILAPSQGWYSPDVKSGLLSSDSGVSAVP